MTQPDAVDAIMKVMQDFLNDERKKIWELAQKQNNEWRKNAERFIQFYIDREAKSPQDSLNQIYAKTVFAGGSVGDVLVHAKELLKTSGHNSDIPGVQELVGNECGPISAHQIGNVRVEYHRPDESKKEKIISELEVRIVQLVKGLKNHGSHDPNCKLCLGPPKHVRPCGCGFDEALNGSAELDAWSNIQIAFPFGHRYDCFCGISDSKVVPCNCGLHDALKKIEKYNNG